MNDAERETLERRIDELCAEVEKYRSARDASVDLATKTIDRIRELEAEVERLKGKLSESYDESSALEVENLRLSHENFKLQQHLEAEKQRNAKLREAVATAIKVQTVLCGDADSLYCRKKCPLHRQESDDCLACDVIGVAQELGIEVN